MMSLTDSRESFQMCVCLSQEFGIRGPGQGEEQAQEANEPAENPDRRHHVFPAGNFLLLLAQLPCPPRLSSGTPRVAYE